MSNKEDTNLTKSFKYKFPLFLIISVVLYIHSAMAQGNVTKLTCISVSFGQVELNWQSPVDPCNSFHGYYIYASKNKNGPYILLDSVLVLAQNFYIHASANAGNSPWHYYIISKYDCGGNALPPTDTLSSMKLDVINNNSGAAQISWNRPFGTSKPVSASLFFLIYREYPAGVWTLIDSTKSNFYKDTIVAICSNTQLNYQIKVRDSSGCFSVSSVFGGIFRDVIPPPVPLIDTVSVNPLSGFACLGWNVNPASDTKAYVIYSYLNGIWTPADTISGRFNTYYSGNTSPYDASSGSKIFKVAAMDSCGNISPAVLLYNTIYLSSTFDLCSRSAKLSWNTYNNSGGSISYYAVYYSENGGIYKPAGTTNTTSFLHSGLKTGITYCYYVRVFCGGIDKTSTSNSVCVFNSGIPPPAFLYLKTASVIAHNEVKIEFYADTSVHVEGYKIRRSDNLNGPFSEIAKIPASKNPITVFVDKTAITNREEYFYFISAYDNCGYTLLTSNAGHLIRTKANGNSDLTNSITWSDYEAWSGSVLSYSIFRSIAGVWDLKPIAILPAGINSYVDSIQVVIENQGMFCYKVLADEGPGNIYNFNAESYSDSSCAQQSPTFYVPNAFTPNGSNPVFLPISAFADSRYYNMVIFNVWGELIYQSTNLDIGWDGTSAGEPSPQGAYPYIIQMRGLDGTAFEKKGTVNLIR